MIVGLVLSALLLPAAHASALTNGQAKRAAREAVRASSSYQQMSSPYRLKVESCSLRTGRRAACELFRTAPTPC